MDAFTANVVTICISSFGLMGNVLCLLVLFQKNMRKFCYTYLLIGLTFSDIFLLTLSIIRTLMALQVLTNVLAHPTVSIAVFFWDWMCTAGTKLYTVAISLERCFAICSPLGARGRLTPSYGVRIAVGVFLLDLLVTVTSFLYDRYGDFQSFQIYVAVILHFLPFSVVLLLNVIIYFGLRNFQKTRKSLNEIESSEQVSVTRMLFTVVAVFGFCYSFEFTRRILSFQKGYFDYDKYEYYDYLINQLADIGYVLNSSVNFLIYYLLGKTFRHQTILLIKRFFWGKPSTSKRPITKTQSNISNTTTLSTNSSTV